MNKLIAVILAVSVIGFTLPATAGSVCKPVVAPTDPVPSADGPA